MTLQPSEYDASYFDGNLQSLKHNAGYTRYKKWHRRCADILPVEESTGEFWGDVAKKMTQLWNLQGKKILDIGCAYGFIVEALRNQGVDAYGIDVSQYAYDQADPAIQPYLTVADARTHLSNYRKFEFDAVFSRWFLDCMDDSDIPDLVDELNRITKQQVHIINPNLNPTYYNPKTAQQWLDGYDWRVGTRIGTKNDLSDYLTK